MDHDALTKKIEKLINMRVDRGATRAEMDIAAGKIGILIMEHGLPAKVIHQEKIVYREIVKEPEKNVPPKRKVQFAEVSLYDENTALITNVKAIKESDKALYCRMRLAAGERKEWFPFSHIDEDSEVNKDGDVGNLIVSKWIAKQKELI